MDKVQENEVDKVQENKEPEIIENTTEAATVAVETNPVEVSDNAVLRKLLVSFRNLCTSIVFEMSDHSFMIVFVISAGAKVL